MATCPVCATENADVARFCMACGAALVAPEPAREARKVVTVVFADITGSTGLGERLDPETMRSIMGRWFEAMRAVLERHDGSVEKFIGDAVVAVFGVPVVHEDDALRAVRAAAEMQVALATLNEALRTERGLEIAMRVGVNTGVVVVGDARAGGSRATGDAVNVAARLQQAAEPGETLVGDSTWRLVRDAVTTGEPREVQVKGRDEPVTVRRLVAVDQAAEAIHRRVGGPMIGRDRELGILRAAFERAVVEERCVLVTVLGSAGVGKSRLVHEFLAGARTDAQVLRGRCLPYGQGITWYPVAELLRSAVGLDEEAEPAAVIDRLRDRLAGVDDAEAILTRLAEPLGIATEPAPVEELFWAIRRFLEHLAFDGPGGRRPRRPAVGRTGAARSRRPSRRVGPRRPAVPARDGPTRAPRPPRRLGRRQARRDDLPARTAAVGRHGAPRRGAAGGRDHHAAGPASGSPPPPTATRCTSSRSSRCSSTTGSSSADPTARWSSATSRRSRSRPRSRPSSRRASTG